MNFAANHITPRMIRSKRVLEVGIEYGIKAHIQFYNPDTFVGINTRKRLGNDVDHILSVHDISNFFGFSSFDFVYATEVLEHLANWKHAIKELKAVTKVGGYLLLTTRSKGYPLHGAAHGDYWRFEIDDFKFIFSDFDCISLQSDEQKPGVLYLGRKTNRNEPSLDRLLLYSIISNRLERDVPKQSMGVRLGKSRLLISELLSTLADRVSLDFSQR